MSIMWKREEERERKHIEKWVKKMFVASNKNNNRINMNIFALLILFIKSRMIALFYAMDKCQFDGRKMAIEKWIWKDNGHCNNNRSHAKKYIHTFTQRWSKKNQIEKLRIMSYNRSRQWQKTEKTSEQGFFFFFFFQMNEIKWNNIYL